MCIRDSDRSRIKSLCIFITDVYLSLDSEFIVNYIESKNIVITVSYTHLTSTERLLLPPLNIISDGFSNNGFS